MNKANVKALIDGVRQAEKFDMTSHSTCLCGVGFTIAHGGKPPDKLGHGEHDWWASRHLWEWLGMDEDTVAREKLVLPFANSMWDRRAITKAQAIDMLERFATSGKVEWRL